MKDNAIFSLLIWLTLSLIFYLVGSGINLSFSIFNWGTLSRVVYFSSAGITFLIGIFFVIVSDE